MLRKKQCHQWSLSRYVPEVTTNGIKSAIQTVYHRIEPYEDVIFTDILNKETPQMFNHSLGKGKRS